MYERVLIFFIMMAIISPCYSCEDKVEIITINHPKYDGMADEALEKACLNWKVSEPQVGDILHAIVAISSQERHKTYYHLPCTIDGLVSIDGKKTNFELNAAGYAVLGSGENYAYLGCQDSTCFSYFLIKERDLGH